MKKILVAVIILLLIFVPRVNASSNDRFVFEQANSKFNNVSPTDTHFDLRNYNLLTDVKNQNNTNACWAFATNTSIESNLLLNNMGYYDLSEAHLELATQSTYMYNDTFKRSVNNGGNFYVSAAYLMNSYGSVYESELPFSKLLNLYNNNILVNNNEVTNVKGKIDVNSIAFIGTNSKCTPSVISDIKEYLITNGALAATMYVDNTNVFKKYNYYNGLEREDLLGNKIAANQNVNHGVTIIGWDDNVSVSEFGTSNPPTRNGAFIIQNSYGKSMSIGSVNSIRNMLFNKYNNRLNIMSLDELTEDRIIFLISNLYEVNIEDVYINNNMVYINIGDKGYQYVSYDDIHICGNVVGFFNASNEVEDYSYYYDYLGYNAVYNIDRKTVNLLSFFDKKSSNNEELQEVSMFFTEPNQKYEVYFANGEEKNTNNAIKIAEGVSKFVGYDTIKINNKPIIKSDRFTILIKLSSDNNINLGVSLKLDGNYEDIKLTSDVQFISIDGDNYADVSLLDGGNFQLTIKAYTNDSIKESNLIEHDNTPDKNINVLIDKNIQNNNFVTTFKKNSLIIIISSSIVIFLIVLLIKVITKKEVD